MGLKSGLGQGGLAQGWPCRRVPGLHAQTYSVPRGLFPGFPLVLASPGATWERGEQAPRAEAADGLFVTDMSYPVGSSEWMGLAHSPGERVGDPGCEHQEGRVGLPATPQHDTQSQLVILPL